MKLLTGIAGLFAPLAVMAQLESPVPIVLEGSTNADRQLKGLELPAASDHGASAEAVRFQVVQRTTTNGTNTLTASLSPSASGYSAGMLLSVEPTTANDTAVTLNVDGLGAVPLLKFTNEPLDSADLRPGIPVLLVFDGAAFQLISQTGLACPPGMLEVNRDVCVEAAPSGPASWYNAVSICNLRGFRLCGWADWFKGCSMPGGFVNTIVEYEWLDNASNDNNHGKRVGLATGTTTPDCYGGGTMIPSGSNNFRCCYNK